MLATACGARLDRGRRWRYRGDMADRDVERDVNRDQFVATLRRVADAVEEGEAVRIQVAGKRFTVPATAALSIEHEAEEGDEELELQLRWRSG